MSTTDARSKASGMYGIRLLTNYPEKEFRIREFGKKIYWISHEIVIKRKEMCVIWA